MIKDLKAMMRVTVAGRKETFVFLFYTASPKFVYLLNETTDLNESIELSTIEKIIDQDVREPKIPMDILVEHLKDSGVNSGDGIDYDIYGLISEGRITNSRVSDFFQKMIDNVDYEELERQTFSNN